MPRRRRGQARWGVLIGAAAFLAAAPFNAAVSLAAGTWTISATGRAVAVSAVVPRGMLPTTTVHAKSIGLEWAPSMYATGREVGRYVVMRQVVGGKDAVQVCAVTAPIRACEDSPPADQQAIYTVVPAEQLWRGPSSAPSSPVTLPSATLAVAAIAPSALPSISASPTPTPSSTETPAPTPAPTPTPSPSVSESPSPTPTPTPAPG